MSIGAFWLIILIFILIFAHLTRTNMKESIIGRAAEKAELQKIFESGKAEFVAIYGRRRVGKTFLIKEFFEDCLVFSVAGLAKGNTRLQIKNFYKTVQRYDSSLKESPKDWIDAFDILIRYIESLGGGRKVILLDELPWMDTPKSGFIPALEHFWNGWASSRKDVVLVVCGSATSWMMDKLIDDHGGLHNRLTKRIFLRPFTLSECESMLNSMGVNLSRYEISVCYMILGGIPYYLSLIDSGKSLTQNIDSLLFSEDGDLHNEFENLYSALFKNSDDYIKVVTALSEVRGGLSRSEVVEKTGIPTGGTLTKILKNLSSCGFVRKHKDIGAGKEDIFQLVDFYSLFYFKFLCDRHSYEDGYWMSIQGTSKFYTWAGLSFEILALQHVHQIKQSLGISGVMTSEYSWRSPNAQIDLVIDRKDRTVNLCEMKFSEDDYHIDEEEDAKLRRRVSSFKENLGKESKSVRLTFVTTYGLAGSRYDSRVNDIIILNDLFK